MTGKMKMLASGPMGPPVSQSGPWKEESSRWPGIQQGREQPERAVAHGFGAPHREPRDPVTAGQGQHPDHRRDGEDPPQRALPEPRPQDAPDPIVGKGPAFDAGQDGGGQEGGGEHHGFEGDDQPWPHQRVRGQRPEPGHEPADRREQALRDGEEEEEPPTGAQPLGSEEDPPPARRHSHGGLPFPSARLSIYFLGTGKSR